jgi:Cu+-exporting ATPase
VIAIADPIRPTTSAALEELRREGLSIIMLTGDHRETAMAIASTLGITEVRAEVLPADKRAVVAGLQQAGRVVAMAGDGINDAPALAERTSASRWAPAPTSPWRAPASRWSKATCAASCARAGCRARPRQHPTESVPGVHLQHAGRPIAAGVLYPFLGC